VIWDTMLRRLCASPPVVLRGCQRAVLPRVSPLSTLATLTRAHVIPPPLPLSSLFGSTRALSSSIAGMERAGLPRLDRDSRGAAQGPQKGGKGRRNLGGVLAIKNTWNNTLISVSDSSYKQLGFVSGGTVGFKKSKRSSQFATEKAISEAFAKAKSVGIRRVMISMSGPAITLRKPLFKQIREQIGIRIVKLRMSDNVPHGGCRPRKSRRRRWKTKARRR